MTYIAGFADYNTSNKKVNYSLIALKGLMYGYKRKKEDYHKIEIDNAVKDNVILIFKLALNNGFDLSLYTCTLGGTNRITVRCNAVETR